jgi:uncharacterized protein (TIGR00730 family)
MTTVTGIKRLCVFCGSSTGDRPGYVAAARELGTTLARQGIGLVYGGASVGLMGAVADATLAAGGEVIGVIPEALVRKEVAHGGPVDLRIVGSMHERKAMMAELSCGFVALPGGIGTLEELFEIWTWAQLGHHRKPCALLNVGGFYDPLIAFLDGIVERRFLKAEHRGMLIVVDAPDALLARLRDYAPPVVGKWLTGEDV